jgi:ABC-type polysaccharide/polyol phosphate transport system ATPase subunit
MKDFIFRSGILILASHDQGILSSFCKESILLDKGQIVERTVLKDPDPG